MSFNKKRLAKIASNPMVRLGIPAMATVLLGTLFYSEIVRINHLVPNRPSGLKEEDIVDSFNIDHELKVRSEAQRAKFRTL